MPRAAESRMEMKRRPTLQSLEGGEPCSVIEENFGRTGCIVKPLPAPLKAAQTDKNGDEDF